MLSIKFSPISARRPGLSLIEIMIAMVMTLIVLGAMMAAFAYGSSEMQKGRATIELNNRLIIAEEQLRRDLDRITVEFKPHQQLSILPKGYAEIVDGPQTDYIAANDSATGPNSLVFGDRDDFFACTIKTDGKHSVVDWVTVLSNRRWLKSRGLRYLMRQLRTLRTCCWFDDNF